jgi:hypothetical protein
MRGGQKNDDDRYAETILNFSGKAGAVVWIREERDPGPQMGPYSLRGGLPRVG